MVRSRGLVVLSLVALAAFACGGNNNTTTNKGTIKIGVTLPLSGASASDGQPTLKGVEYAVNQQNAKGGVDGYTLQVVSKDYAPAGTIDTAIGKNNMLDLVGDTSVLAVMGPFNSGVARQQLPVANQANLVMVSPANTNPCLTVDLAACHFPQIGFWPSQLRPYGPNNYFRVAATDVYQGGAAADYAYTTLGIKTIGVFDDETSYGIGIAEYFAEHFCKLGGTVVGGCSPTSAGGVSGIKHYDPTTITSFAPILNSLRQGGATALYAGGNASEKLCVARNQSKDIFASDSAFLMGDGGTDSECLDTAAAQAKGMVGTVAAEDQSKLSSDAKTVITNFKAAMGSGPTDFGAYTIAAYAATQTIIAGLDKAIKANSNNMPTRAQVRDAMSSLAPVATPLGNVSFDKNGDTTVQIVAFYKADAKGSGSSELTCGSTNTSTCWEFVSSQNYAGQTYP
jgi:branched-chain amino acid transport system substrate-binding protein